MAAFAVPSASAHASVTIGSALSFPPDAARTCAGTERCTIAHRGTAGPAFVAPIDGRIIRWRTRVNTGAGTRVALQVVRPTPGATAIGVGRSEEVSTTGTDVATFTTNLRVRTGDRIGLAGPLGSVTALLVSGAPAESEVAKWSPELPDNAPAGVAPNATESGVDLPVSADIAARPTSALGVPACSRTGLLNGSVTSDVDPAVTPRALNAIVDGATLQRVVTTGRPGAATLRIPEGRHTVEWWGEDSLGQNEAFRRSTPVTVDSTPPAITYRGLPASLTFTRGQFVAFDVAASDNVTGLALDPSATGVRLDTGRSGTFTVDREAVDGCGNRRKASFTYRVIDPPAVTAVRVTKTGGLRFAYRLSRPASVRFVLERARPGVRRGTRCVAGRTARRRCTRWVTYRPAFTRTRTQAGADRFRYPGRRLPEGRYRVVIAGAADGVFGLPVRSASFRIRAR